jgi:hypothetical protein
LPGELGGGKEERLSGYEFFVDADRCWGYKNERWQCEKLINEREVGRRVGPAKGAGWKRDILWTRRKGEGHFLSEMSEDNLIRVQGDDHREGLVTEAGRKHRAAA